MGRRTRKGRQEGVTEGRWKEGLVRQESVLRESKVLYIESRLSEERKEKERKERKESTRGGREKNE